MTRVYVRHVREHYCLIPGARDYFQANGLDFKDFIRNGIDVLDLSHIHDEACALIIATAVEEEDNG